MSREAKELKSREKVLPVDFSKGNKYEHVIMWSGETRECPLSVWQRIKIAFGYNVIITVTCISEHKPGRMAFGVKAETTQYDFATIKGASSGISTLKARDEAVERAENAS